MSNWKDVLKRIASNADQKFDELHLRLQQRLRSDKSIQILPYLGYGTAAVARLHGRVLRMEDITQTTDYETVWDNLLNTYRYLESDEIPYAKIKATLGTSRALFAANDEGYFKVELPTAAPLPNGMWHKVILELEEAPLAFEKPVVAIGRVLVPPANAAFGIISDIDDTVMQSNATSYLKAARLMFLKNARTRLPFSGVAALYHALQQNGRNPIFYVSSSPWNLYPLLSDFFEFQKIPMGPLFLKDYGFTRDQLFTSGHTKHKLEQIAKIMNTYPHMSFVLIGDSGQRDPEIYRAVVQQYPGRVKTIYIRDVSDDKRDAEVIAIADEVTKQGVPMIFAADSLAAAEHAAAQGLIHSSTLPTIHQAMQADMAAPSTVEKLLDE